MSLLLAWRHPQVAILCPLHICCLFSLPKPPWMEQGVDRKCGRCSEPLCHTSVSSDLGFPCNDQEEGSPAAEEPWMPPCPERGDGSFALPHREYRRALTPLLLVCAWSGAANQLTEGEARAHLPYPFPFSSVGVSSEVNK